MLFEIGTRLAELVLYDSEVAEKRLGGTFLASIATNLDNKVPVKLFA